MASPKLWVEAWTRLGHASFAKRIADVPAITVSGTMPVNGYADGRMTIPKNYDRFDDILKPDVTIPANSVTSLIRVFSENSATPIFEFIPNISAGEADKADPDVEISGPSIDSILGYARVEAWDWTGIDDEHSFWPDWIYGGRNILGEVESAYNPAVTRISTTASSGNFTIGISFNSGAITNTGNIAFNASAATVDAALTAALVSMGFASASIDVSGSGTPTAPWRVETNSPEGEYVFSLNIGTLNAPIGQDRESIGAIVPNGWTTSFNPVNNLVHGIVINFRASHFVSPDPAAPACDTSGVAVVFDGDAGDFPGIQKIVPVKPGGRYYASATAYPQGASGSYRLVIRDLFENPIAAEPDFNSGTTLTSNSWQTMSIPIVTIPPDVDRVIFRFASVDGANPPPTFVACMEMREGMPPTTWGDIWEQLHADATADHAPGRVVWEAGTTNAPYLTLDFDAVNDSNGNPWADPEVSITLKRGQNYLRVASECYKMGYEGRIVPDNVATGTYKFQLYNNGGLGTDQSAISNGPSIQGGRDVTRRDYRRFLPPATNVAVEAGGQNIARSTSSTAEGAMGRIEQYVPNQDLGSLVEAATVAGQSMQVNLQRTQSLNYVLTPTTLDPEPFVAYKAGDILFVLDPPDIPTRSARRIKSLGFAMTKERVEYPIQLESESYVGPGPATAAGVDFLLKEFKAIRERPADATDILNYFPGLLKAGSLPPIVIAAVDTDDRGKALANYVCDGVDDQDTWSEAVADIGQFVNGFQPGVYGSIVCLGGTYTFDDRMTLDTDGYGKLKFTGDGMPRVLMNYNTAGPDGFTPMFSIPGGGTALNYYLTFEQFEFDGDTQSNGICFFQSTLTVKPIVEVRGCMFTNWVETVWWSERGAPRLVHHNNFVNCTLANGVFHFDTGTGTEMSIVHDNIFKGCTGNMVDGSASNNHCLIHHNIQHPTGGAIVLNALGGVVYDGNLF